MTVPTQNQFHRSTLEIVNSADGMVSLREIKDSLIERFSLSESDLSERVPSGGQTRFENRVYWAVSYLRRAGLLRSPSRAMFVITSEGCEFLTRHGGDVDSASLNRLIQARQQQLYSEHQDAGQTIVADIADTDPSDATPHEQLEELYRELDDRLAEDILERVIGATPEQFERLTVRLLESMEYGEGQAIGRRGDQGIDGIINQDPLGLEKVYIQAKRWQNQVGEPEIRTFAGSLEAQGANKGVIH